MICSKPFFSIKAVSSTRGLCGGEHWRDAGSTGILAVLGYSGPEGCGSTQRVLGTSGSMDPWTLAGIQWFYIGDIWGVKVTESAGALDMCWEHWGATGDTGAVGCWGLSGAGSTGSGTGNRTESGTGSIGTLPEAPGASAHAQVLPNSKMAPRRPSPARSGGGADRGPIAAIGCREPGAAVSTNGQAGLAAGHGHVRGAGVGPERGRQRWRRSGHWPWRPARPR